MPPALKVMAKTLIEIDALERAEGVVEITELGRKLIQVAKDIL